MKISVQQYAQSLYDSVKNESETKIMELLPDFVAILGKKRDLNLEPEIVSAFTEMWNKENGEVIAQLISARELDKEARDVVINYLKIKSGAKKITLEETIDKNILGGFILKYNSKIIDGSLKSNLEELRTEQSEKIRGLLPSFVALLDRKHDLNLAPEITAAFTDIWNKENCELVAQITVARELEDHSRELVVDYLREQSGIKKIILEETIDKNILGGFILKYNSKIIDGSLRSNLNELRVGLES